MEKNKSVVKFYNLISKDKVEEYTEIPYGVLRVLSVIPDSALSIPLCIDMLDKGKSYGEISFKTGLTKRQIQTVVSKIK